MKSLFSIGCLLLFTLLFFPPKPAPLVNFLLLGYLWLPKLSHVIPMCRMSNRVETL